MCVHLGQHVAQLSDATYIRCRCEFRIPLRIKVTYIKGQISGFIELKNKKKCHSPTQIKKVYKMKLKKVTGHRTNISRMTVKS